MYISCLYKSHTVLLHARILCQVVTLMVLPFFFCGVRFDHVEISLKASYMSISALQTPSTQTDPTVVLPRSEEKELSSKDMLFWIILSITNYYKYLKKEDTLFSIPLSGMTRALSPICSVFVQLYRFNN